MFVPQLRLFDYSRKTPINHNYRTLLRHSKSDLLVLINHGADTPTINCNRVFSVDNIVFIFMCVIPIEMFFDVYQNNEKLNNIFSLSSLYYWILFLAVSKP